MKAGADTFIDIIDEATDGAKDGNTAPGATRCGQLLGYGNSGKPN